MASLIQYPEVTVVGFQGKDALEIIKGITNEPLQSPEPSDFLEKYSWSIDNKYYTAEIKLCKLKNMNVNHLSPSIFELSEAVIVYIDTSQVSPLNDVQDLLNVLKSNPVDVQLLVCDNFLSSRDVISKENAQKWCIEHGWELVELNLEPTDNHEDDLEDDFIDSWGFTRIKQALNAHTWSNLQLKDKKESDIGHLVRELSLNDKSIGEVPYENLGTTEFEDDWTGDADDDFSVLFSSLGEMKERADALPLHERRLFAAKMATAFLRSLGDDETT